MLRASSVLADTMTQDAGHAICWTFPLSTLVYFSRRKCSSLLSPQGGAEELSEACKKRIL